MGGIGKSVSKRFIENKRGGSMQPQRRTFFLSSIIEES